MGKKPGVLLYWDTFDLLEQLSGEELKAFIFAIKDYAQQNNNPDFSQNRVLSILWVNVKRKLDLDDEHYKAVCAERSKSGKKGAEKKKQNQANATKCQQMLPSVSKKDQNKPTTKSNTTTKLNTNNACDISKRGFRKPIEDNKELPSFDIDSIEQKMRYSDDVC